MNKRIKKKKMKEKFLDGIDFLSRYCELPKDVVMKEQKEHFMAYITEYYTDEDFKIHYDAYLDSISIGLMEKYRTGLYSDGTEAAPPSLLKTRLERYA